RNRRASLPRERGSPVLDASLPPLTRGARFRQWIGREDPLLDWLALDQVLLHEARHVVGGHALVPGPFGIDHPGRPVAADAQAPDLGTEAGVGAGRQSLVLEGLLERLPSGGAGFGRAAAGARAQEDVPAVAADAHLGGRVLEFLLVIHRLLQSSTHA